MTKSKVAFFSALLLSVLSAVFYAASRRQQPSSPANSPGNSNSAADHQNAPIKGSAPSSAQVKAAETRQSYEQAKDLSTFLTDLQSGDTKKSDVDVAHAKAIQECFVFARLPNYAFETVAARQGVGSADQSVQQNYAKTLTGRCLNFATSTPMKLADANKLFEDAAREGSAEAQAHLAANRLIQSGQSPTPEDISTVNKILSSLNSSAIFEMSGAFGTNSKFSGPYYGTEQAQAAWQLVACDLGMDCSEASSVLIGFCLNGGIYCGPGDLRYNMSQSGFSPTDFEEVMSLENKIYTKLKEQGSFIQN